MSEKTLANPDPLESYKEPGAEWWEGRRPSEAKKKEFHSNSCCAAVKLTQADKNNANYEDYVQFIKKINNHDNSDKRGAWPLEVGGTTSRLCLMDYQKFFDANGFDTKTSDLWQTNEKTM